VGVGGVLAEEEAHNGDGDLEEVLAKELSLLRPNVRARPDVVIGLLHESFCEFGASGRSWDRAGVVEALAADPGVGAEVENMQALRLGPDAVLLTYVARRPDRRTLRSSVWIRAGDGWQLVFHQGTVSPD